MANDHIEDPRDLYHEFPETQIEHIRGLAHMGLPRMWLRRNFGLSKGQLKRILRRRS